MKEVTFPVRVLKGVKKLIVSNASGGVNLFIKLEKLLL
jgi:purine nucleoside phosphorylase